MTPILGILASGISGNLWAPGKDFDSIATVTVSTAVSSISFTSIPATYRHLQIRYISMFTDAAQEFNLSFNSDTTAANYARHTLYGDGASAGANAGITTNTRSILYTRNASSIIPGTSVVDILDYANTNKYKTLRGLNGQDYNGSGVVALISGVWMNSASAITSITLAPGAGNISQYSQFALYGIK
jgi:hypothetical protein